MADYSELIYLYKKGNEYNAYNHFGAHLKKDGAKVGAHFAVYAPNAKKVFLTGDFNNWDNNNLMECYQGIWHAYDENAKPGQCYKYLIYGADGSKVFRADPYAFSSELRPKNASIIADPFTFEWKDAGWMKSRAAKNHADYPINIYEVQLSSWDTVVKDETPIDLDSTGKALVEYAKSMHYTHIELMPVTEYPLDGSWGYQTTGYFSLSGRYGTPDKLQRFVELCHNEGLGVILDWVPGHFCPDEHGLTRFDGTSLFGSQLHPHWGTYKFDFSNKSVWSFLLSSAVFWANVYHIDGIRADGVTSMLYLNYGDETAGSHNSLGDDDDLDAKDFLQLLNSTMHSEFPGFLTFAEESSAYAGVTAPTQNNGLGFDYKWNMGWMNDTLDYFSAEPGQKHGKHDKITFSSVYMRDEKFVLPFSHDEVVHGKKQLLEKMPGDDWHKFAALRTLMAYQTLHPGKKLNFMGNDIAQRMEWRYYEPVEWFMLKYPIHDSFHEYVKKLNELYCTEPALYESDNDLYGFEWIDGSNRGQNVFSFIRRAKDSSEIIAVINASWQNYGSFRLGVPCEGEYTEIISSNLKIYDGSGEHNGAPISSENVPSHGKDHSIVIEVPALCAMAFKRK